MNAFQELPFDFDRNMMFVMTPCNDMTMAKSKRFRFSHMARFISVSTDRDESLATSDIAIELGIEEKVSWREVVRARILY
jgi:hypothetical protein